MFQITVSTTLNRKPAVLKNEATYTPADAIREAGFEGVPGSWMINGSTVRPEQMGMTFAALGYGAATGRKVVNLTNVSKRDNA